MNNKGFAITGMLYSVLIIFLVLLVTLLFNLQNRKTILDELKADAINAVENDNNYEYLLNEINTLKAQLVTMNNKFDATNDFVVIGSISRNSAYTFTIDYSQYEKIGLGLYNNSKSALYDYIEVPIELFKNLNKDNNGNIRVHYGNDNFAYARYISETEIMSWVSDEAETNEYYGVIYGIK